ncbi:MAG: GH92 family glycosyl hydrolase [Bacteroidales bacterium]|nr:GH92 family glycosyl hydrolase [Bacteroidales bacterium]
MRNILPLCLITLFASCTVKDNTENNYTQYVNPFIGTDFTGNTYPGATVPFGMVQLSPDNGLPGWDRIAGYYYPDSTIAGFSHTHLTGTGAGDLYDISFMPVTIPFKEENAPLGVYSLFSHNNEEAHPGYYKVRLSDYDINVELTSTKRCGIQKYTFPKAEAAVFLNLSKAMNWDFTLDSEIQIVDSITIRGYRKSEGWANDQRVYFVSQFSKPFEEVYVDTTSIFYPKDKRYTGKGVIARFDFKTEEGEEILVRTAISGVSMAGALRNLKEEAFHWDFSKYRSDADAMWNKELAKIEAKSGDHDKIVNFYTALYHTMTAPTLFCDVDGKYFGADKKIYEANGWENYSTFSLWDTYRAAHPLLTYTQPKRVNDMIESFLAHYREHGMLPVWNFYGNETDMMIGYHSVPVIVDAYLKGVGTFDAKEALAACIATANNDSYRAIGEYKKYGYIPYDKENESVSKTIEYSFDDYCIAVMAEKMDKPNIAKIFYERAGYYKNLFDKNSGFLRPKDSNGNWIDSFNAKDYTSHYTESNAWQYLWGAQHDSNGLKEMLGGDSKMEIKLDSMFTYNPDANDELPIFSTGMIGQYVQGNEPSHHVIYLYNIVNRPDKTQRYISKVMSELYKNTPGGLCGNEDCGQMSAWYVFSAMGFYPLNPVSLEYEIGTPLFKELYLNLDNGKRVSIFANNLSDENIYIKSVKVNEKEYNKSYITHRQIMDGVNIEFEMTNTPQKAWY